MNWYHVSPKLSLCKDAQESIGVRVELAISTGLQGFAYKGPIVQWSAASDQQTPSYKLIGIDLDTEPPSQFMPDKT